MKPGSEPAFPVISNVEHSHRWVTEPGMTIRQYAVIAAIPAAVDAVIALSRKDYSTSFSTEYYREIGIEACKIADAALKRELESREE